MGEYLSPSSVPFLYAKAVPCRTVLQGDGVLTQEDRDEGVLLLHCGPQTQLTVGLRQRDAVVNVQPTSERVFSLHPLTKIIQT